MKPSYNQRLLHSLLCVYIDSHICPVFERDSLSGSAVLNPLFIYSCNDVRLHGDWKARTLKVARLDCTIHQSCASVPETTIPFIAVQSQDGSFRSVGYSFTPVFSRSPSPNELFPKTARLP